jgi:hypothetical protein
MRTAWWLHESAMEEDRRWAEGRERTRQARPQLVRGLRPARVPERAQRRHQRRHHAGGLQIAAVGRPARLRRGTRRSYDEHAPWRPPRRKPRSCTGRQICAHRQSQGG